MVTLPIDAIRVGPRLNRLNPVRVAALRASIDLVGPLHPLIVDEEERLIAGRHRLEAMVESGFTEVQAVRIHTKDDDDLRRLIEVEENRARAYDYRPAEQVSMLLQMEISLTDRGLRAAGGRPRKGKGAPDAPFVTSEMLGAEFGLQKRATQDYLSYGRALGPETCRRLVEHSLGQDLGKKDLEQLARQNEEVRGQVLNLLDNADTDIKAIRVLIAENEIEAVESPTESEPDESHGEEPVNEGPIDPGGTVESETEVVAEPSNDSRMPESGGPPGYTEQYWDTTFSHLNTPEVRLWEWLPEVEGDELVARVFGVVSAVDCYVDELRMQAGEELAFMVLKAAKRWVMVLSEPPKAPAPGDEDVDIDTAAASCGEEHLDVLAADVAALSPEKLSSDEVESANETQAAPRPKSKKWTRVDRERVIALHEKSHKAADIADEVGCSLSSVYNVISKWKEEQAKGEDADLSAPVKGAAEIAARGDDTEEPSSADTPAAGSPVRVADEPTVKVHVSLDLYAEDGGAVGCDETGATVPLLDLHGDAVARYGDRAIVGERIAHLVAEVMPEDIRSLIAGCGWDDCGNPWCTHLLSALDPDCADDLIEKYRGFSIDIDVPASAVWCQAEGMHPIPNTFDEVGDPEMGVVYVNPVAGVRSCPHPEDNRPDLTLRSEQWPTPEKMRDAAGKDALSSAIAKLAGKPHSAADYAQQYCDELRRRGFEPHDSDGSGTPWMYTEARGMAALLRRMKLRKIPGKKGEASLYQWAGQNLRWG